MQELKAKEKKLSELQNMVAQVNVILRLSQDFLLENCILNLIFLLLFQVCSD
jgi:hypothetical protein